jgi:hypothetical protein
MHNSLHQRTALSVALLAVAVLITCFVTKPPSLLAIVPFALLGLAAGLLQALAINAEPQAFRAAKSWANVRAALIKSKIGRCSIFLLWANGLGVLALIVWGGELVSVQTALGAFFSFLLLRELSVFPTIRSLSNCGQQ